MPIRHLPLNWIDRWAGFHPYAWVWIYQSLYLPINIVPWLSERREDLNRYAIGFVILSLISFAVFILYPIPAPRPPVSGASGMYALLLTYDAPFNSLPSLHAGLLVYTLAYGQRIFGRSTPAGLQSLFLLWAMLIFYAILATKEHYFWDIAAGIALAALVHYFMWSRVISDSRMQPSRQLAGPPLAESSAAAGECSTMG